VPGTLIGDVAPERVCWADTMGASAAVATAADESTAATAAMSVLVDAFM
jgi:hypothetical protein